MRKYCNNKGKPAPLLILLILLLVLLCPTINAQTVIKLLASQPELLTVKIPSVIKADNYSAIRLADSIDISGGRPPYSMSWYDGTVLLSQNQSFEVSPTEIPENYRLIITDSGNCRVEKNLTIGVGVEEEMLIPVKVYPVPASTYLIIDPGDFAGEIQLSVYTLEGRKIRELKLTEKKTLDIEFPAGTYILELKTGIIRSVRKIIISK